MAAASAPAARGRCPPPPETPGTRGPAAPRQRQRPAAGPRRTPDPWPRWEPRNGHPPLHQEERRRPIALGDGVDQLAEVAAGPLAHRIGKQAAAVHHQGHRLDFQQAAPARSGQQKVQPAAPERELRPHRRVVRELGQLPRSRRPGARPGSARRCPGKPTRPLSCVSTRLKAVRRAPARRRPQPHRAPGKSSSFRRPGSGTCTYSRLPQLHPGAEAIGALQEDGGDECARRRMPATGR